MESAEILCSACGQEALLIRLPTYDGFKKVGERLTCAACGHEYAREADVPFKAERKVEVFTEADRPDKVEIFEEGEAERLCRYCASYVVNPFVQWCSLHKKAVEATGSCGQFEPKGDAAD